MLVPSSNNLDLYKAKEHCTQRIKIYWWSPAPNMAISLHPEPVQASGRSPYQNSGPVGLHTILPAWLRQQKSTPSGLSCITQRSHLSFICPPLPHPSNHTGANRVQMVPSITLNCYLWCYFIMSWWLFVIFNFIIYCLLQPALSLLAGESGLEVK